MPTEKIRLSRSEQADHRTAVQQLQEWGLIPKTPDQLKSSAALDIRVNPMASQVIELPTGTPYYAIWVELVARQAGLILAYCRITTKWDDQIMLASDEVKRRIPGAPFYPPEQLLNERLEDGLRFRHRGDTVRGMIIAWGVKRIPDVYRDDSIVPFELAFTDSLGNQSSTRAALQVSRRREPEKKMQRAKEDLFGRLRGETMKEKERPDDLVEGTRSDEPEKRRD